MGIIRLVYDTLLAIALVFVLPVWWYTYRKKGYSIGLLERFLLKKECVPKGSAWVHCASVGEINTALPVIDHLKSKGDVFLTVFSPRAYRFAKDNLGIPVLFLPFDISFLVRKFINVYKPKVLIIEEAEFWLNLITVSSESIPVMSINTNPPKNKFLNRIVLKRISRFVVKTPKDMEILRRLVSEDRIVLCGNLKLLSKVNQKSVEIDLKGRRVILAGSTHPPEEDVILRIFKEVKTDFPDTLLMIAPRHTERIGEVESLVKKYGFSYTQRSTDRKPKGDVYLVDTLGELSSLYRYADVVFVGGTISKIGGHNIFEPILSGKKVIIGRNYHKIKGLVREAQNFGAIWIVETEEQLKDSIKKQLREGSFNVDFSLIQRQIYDCYKKEIDRWI
ncbi:MAG: 3-deoxy-D-manno-octulosonic acid transferase [Hydrogenothermaceae bacterium]|nr:3-deoxy-D-manno-octulosonic acid transferase [Hydrogenothermaceae bacterium]